MVDFDTPVSFRELSAGNVFEYNSDLCIRSDKNNAYRLFNGLFVQSITSKVIRKEAGFRGIKTARLLAGKLEVGEIFQHDDKLYMKVRPNVSVRLKDGKEVAITQDMHVFQLAGECQVRDRIMLDKVRTDNRYLVRMAELQSRPDFMESIKQKGVLKSITVKRKGDKFDIVDGHFRYEASRELGLASIPCQILPKVNFDYLH